MARKGWDALSPEYRKRIEKAGLSKADYEAGGSLKKARGHSNTPERPSQYDKKQYPQYARERAKVERDIETKKQLIWGDRPKWNAKKSKGNLAKYPPSMRLMRWALQATKEEIQNALREDPGTFAFLGYN